MVRRSLPGGRFAIAAGLAILSFNAAFADEFFTAKVVPILQRRCLSCHSGDAPKGDFSLRSKDTTFADGSIEPGDAGSSHLVDLITPVNGRAEMPKGADPLSPEDRSVIEKWISAGAKWPDGITLQEPKVDNFDWWSYQPLRRPEVPTAPDGWVRNPVDHFILAELNQRKLSHANEADRRTLIRRVTYDLTGLPPSSKDVAAFLNDTRPDAYGELVDRLLASERYGERWARHWLDVVKYADTCGYDKDKLRPNAWPYRDYVIRAFNDDKPFSRFLQEQIAGDVLFPEEPDGILGLGFIAAGPWDFIGHVEVSEKKLDGKVARNLDRDDMVSNVLNTFCSTTIQCARCHNHKFDPITQEHYYGLQAVFAAVDKAERVYDMPADVKERRQQLNAKQKSLNEELKAAAATLSKAAGPRLAELEKQIKDLNSKIKVKKDVQFGFHSMPSDKQNTERWVEIEFAEPVDASKIILNPTHDEHAGIGAGFGFPVRFKVAVAEKADDWTVVSDHTVADYLNPGITPVEINDINTSVRRVRITATKLMKRTNDFIFALAEVQVISQVGNNVAIGAKVVSSDSIEAPSRWARINLTDGLWPKPADPKFAEALRVATAEHSELLSKPEVNKAAALRDSLQASINTVKADISKLPAGKMVYAAATHFSVQGNFMPTKGTPRAIHVLHRGDINQPREPATPGILPLGTESDWKMTTELSEAERRAQLARWLSNENHPLVWRSIVNRVWQYHFGKGIVATPNDFGRMGAEPTHPELLDWLAVEFRDNGQSFKKLHRLIVTSSTYRQSSTGNTTNAKTDGSNQYLWRANRRRLEAEEIRDSILTVSGAMDLKMGGPGFYLFNLEKPEHSPHYEYHKFDPANKQSHRRSIYRFIARSQPDPWMTTLDCADSSQSTPRRVETLTSLQALSLMNSRFNLYMGQQFASRLEQESGDLPENVDRAFDLILQRAPSHAERQDLTAYAEQHGLPNLCRFLFNLSEFVFVD